MTSLLASWPSGTFGDAAQEQPAFPQVNAICGDKNSLPKNKLGSGYIPSTFRRDLRRYATELRLKPTPTRERRHRLDSAVERRGKLIAETGFDLLGIMCEPPQEQWARPQAQTLYHKLMQRDPGKPSDLNYEGEDLKHLAWMLEAELIDIDPDGSIWMLSDVEPPDDAYPGAMRRGKIMIAGKLKDRAGIGRTHTSEETAEYILQVWRAIADGHPLFDIPAEQRLEMNARNGVRVGARTFTRQINRLLAKRMNEECHCLGRDQVEQAWDLADHAAGCPAGERFFHVETVRRVVQQLVLSGELVRTSGAFITRKGHTEYRIPCAYKIPADAGWHEYAAVEVHTRRRPWSVLRKRLLGFARQSADPALEDES